MKTMSAIYQKVRHRMNDDWAYGNGECCQAVPFPDQSRGPGWACGGYFVLIAISTPWPFCLLGLDRALAILSFCVCHKPQQASGLEIVCHVGTELELAVKTKKGHTR